MAPTGVIRHPSYTGLFLIMTAVGLLIGSWWPLVALTAAVMGGLVFRIQVERALRTVGGDDYRNYAVTRERLVPFIW